jgi:hypothetical protein
LKNDLQSREQRAVVSLRQSQEWEAQAIADVRKVMGRFGVQFEAVVDGGGSPVLAADEMRRANEQLGAAVAGLKLRVQVLEQTNPGTFNSKELFPQCQKALCLLANFSGPAAVVGVARGSRVTSGLSVWGLASVAVRDMSSDFTFIIGDHRCQRRSSVAQFLSPRVSEFIGLMRRSRS